MGVSIASMAEHDRPRERLLERGVGALRDGELLALVLRNGRTGESAVSLADELLEAFGGLDGLRSARPEELANHRGVGPAKAAAVVAACSLSARAASATPEARMLTSASDVAAVAGAVLAGARRERVVVLVVDGGLRLRQTVILTEGASDRSLVPTRDVLNAVIRHDGRGFALAHNHPGGDPTPSLEDRRSTAAVAAAAKVVGLRFLGHVVVAGSTWAEVRTTSTPQTPGSGSTA